MLKVDGVRMVVFDHPLWYAYLREMEIARLKVAGVWTGSSFDLGLPLEPQAYEIATKVDLWLNLITNESNDDNLAACWPGGGIDNTIRTYNEIGHGIRRANPHARLALGGVYSMRDPRPWFRDVLPYLDPQPDVVDYHLYREGYDQEWTADGFEGTGTLIPSLEAEFGFPFVCYEWNDKDPAGIKRFQKVLVRTTAESAFFAYHNVEGLGVMDDNGRRKPEWYAYREAIGA